MVGLYAVLVFYTPPCLPGTWRYNFLCNTKLSPSLDDIKLQQPMDDNKSLHNMTWIHNKILVHRRINISSAFLCSSKAYKAVPIYGELFKNGNSRMNNDITSKYLNMKEPLILSEILNRGYVL